MNVLIFSWRGPNHPNAGGAEISTHEHAKKWIEKGSTVTLFTASFEGAKEKETIDGVNIIRKGYQVFGVQINAFWWYLFDRHDKFNIVVDQFHGIPFLTPLFVRVKKMAFIHEVAKEVWWLNSWQKPLNLIPAIIGFIFEPLIFYIFYRGIPFMTVSESTKKDLIEWGIPKNNVTVVHNGITIPKRIISHEKEIKWTVIFLGALSRDKGVEDVLKIFSEIDKKENNCQLWIVGRSDPSYLIKLNNLARKLGILSKIKFWGFVSEEKKFELLSKSHILVNPSIREGWGLVVIEAASVGVPTVAYNIPGLRDSVINGKTGILTSENTIEDLTNNILKLLNDKNLYREISKNAISWSKNFSWDKSSKQSFNLIKKILIDTD